MHVKPVVAWRMVGDAWGLKKREVQKIIADNGATALALLPKFAVTPETCSVTASGTLAASGVTAASPVGLP